MEGRGWGRNTFYSLKRNRNPLPLTNKLHSEGNGCFPSNHSNMSGFIQAHQWNHGGIQNQRFFGTLVAFLCKKKRRKEKEEEKKE